MCAVDIRPAFRTERLVLRGPTRGDAPEIAELASDAGVSPPTRTAEEGDREREGGEHDERDFRRVRHPRMPTRTR